MSLQHQLDRQNRKLERQEAEKERLVRLTIVGYLKDMDIEETSKVAQYVLAHFSPQWEAGGDSTIEDTFGPAAIFEWLTEVGEIEL